MDAFQFQSEGNVADGGTHLITLRTVDALSSGMPIDDGGLNRGDGGRELQWQDLREIVTDVLLAQDGEEYRLGDFVVMPNHLHALVGMYPGRNVAAQCEMWISRSTELINAFRSRTGDFWCADPVCEPVRNWDEFDERRKTLRRDPKAAGLRVGEYYLHVAEDD